jgi:hypothetical protein
MSVHGGKADFGPKRCYVRPKRHAVKGDLEEAKHHNCERGCVLRCPSGLVSNKLGSPPFKGMKVPDVLDVSHFAGV